MIEMTFQDLSKPNMWGALRKLGSHEFTDHKAGYHVGRILDIIDSQVKALRMEALALNKKHAVLDEAGKPVLDPENPARYKLDDSKREAFEADEMELAKRLVVIDKHKIKRGDVAGIKFTPGELLELETLLED